jgi:hypothetical protein
MGSAIAYHCFKGDIDPTEVSKKYRECYTKGLIITQDNAADYLENYVENPPDYDYDNAMEAWKEKSDGQIRKGD